MRRGVRLKRHPEPHRIRVRTINSHLKMPSSIETIVRQREAVDATKSRFATRRPQGNIDRKIGPHSQATKLPSAVPTGTKRKVTRLMKICQCSQRRRS